MSDILHIILDLGLLCVGSYALAQLTWMISGDIIFHKGGRPFRFYSVENGDTTENRAIIHAAFIFTEEGCGPVKERYYWDGVL